MDQARRPTHRAALAALALAAAGTAARADPGPVRLDYHAAPDCPGPAALRAAVVESLGRDPFGEGGARVMTVTVSPARATVTLRGGDGFVGERIVASAGDCDELVRAAGFTAALALDPFAAPRPAVRARPVPPRPRATPAPAAARAAGSAEGVSRDGRGADGRVADGRADDVTVADGTIADGTTGAGTGDDGMVDDGMVDDGMVDDGMVDDGMVDDGMVDDNTAVAGRLAGGTPNDDTPDDGAIGDGMVAGGTPASGSPAGDAPAGGTVANGTPADGATAGPAPIDGKPADGIPANGISTARTPAATPTPIGDTPATTLVSATPPDATTSPAPATPSPTLTAALGGGAGLHPGPGLHLDAAARLPAARWRFELGARLDAGRGALGDGVVQSLFVAALTAACHPLGPLEPCLGALAGWHAHRGDGYASDGAADAFTLAGVARVGWPIDLGGVTLIPRAELLVPATRTTLTIDGAAAWETPPAAFTLGVGVR